MRAFALAIVCITLLAPARAVECVPSTSSPEVDAAGRAYVDLDLCTPHFNCLDSVWVYEESNGILGLQRADEIHDDTCGGRIPGDTIVF